MAYLVFCRCCACCSFGGAHAKGNPEGHSFIVVSCRRRARLFLPQAPKKQGRDTSTRRAGKTKTAAELIFLPNPKLSFPTTSSLWCTYLLSKRIPPTQSPDLSFHHSPSRFSTILLSPPHSPHLHLNPQLMTGQGRVASPEAPPPHPSHHITTNHRPQSPLILFPHTRSQLCSFSSRLFSSSELCIAALIPPHYLTSPHALEIIAALLVQERTRTRRTHLLFLHFPHPPHTHGWPHHPSLACQTLLASCKISTHFPVSSPPSLRFLISRHSLSCMSYLFFLLYGRGRGRGYGSVPFAAVLPHTRSTPLPFHRSDCLSPLHASPPPPPPSSRGVPDACSEKQEHGRLPPPTTDNE